MRKEIDALALQAVKGTISRRRFLGRAGALGLSAVAANSLLSSAARAQPKKGGNLRMGIGGGESTNSLDPAAATMPATYIATRMLAEKLMDVNPDGSFDFRLAESVESDATGKVWAFRIRKGVEFHNGKTLTPDDVLATMQRHSDENTKSGALGGLRSIESMRVDGDMFIVEGTTPNADLAYLLADKQLLIQPNGGRDNPADGIGTNAYRVVEENPGVGYRFERFKNYWDDSRGHFDSIDMLIINDDTARNAALQSRQVDIVNRVAPKLAKLLNRADGVTVKSASGRAHYVFPMRCDTAPFDNNDLRLALKYAINRQELVDKVLQGYGSIGNDFPVNAAYPLFDETIPQRTYNPDLAKEHYAKSGHDGSPIVLRISENAFPGAMDAAQLLLQSITACGIPFKVHREPSDGYWSEVWNKEPFCASYWNGRPTQDQVYSTTYLSSADWNETKFRNPRFDEILIEARKEMDQSRRKALYSEAGYLVRDEGGAIIPMFNDFIDAMSDKIEGWEVNGNATMMDGLMMTKCWFA